MLTEPKYIICGEDTKGKVHELFHWSRDEASGVNRARVEANIFNKTYKKIFAKSIINLDNKEPQSGSVMFFQDYPEYVFFIKKSGRWFAEGTSLRHFITNFHDSYEEMITEARAIILEKVLGENQ